MTINTYAESVRDKVAEMTGKTVEVRTVAKANAELTAVVVQDGNVGMNFYVDDDFNADTPIEVCADKVVDCYDNSPRPDFDYENFDFSFNAIKDKLVARVLDVQRNKSFLDDAVYKDVGCGLALISDIVVGNYRMTVRKGLADSENYDAEKLFAKALNNSKPRLTSMMSAICGGGGDLLNDDAELDDEMYVLTNEDGYLGASVMFNDGILQKIRNKFGCGYFVLPSSVHEVILVPDNGRKSADDLKKIVVEANRCVVEPAEVLSDNVFRYDSKLEIVA